MMVAPVATLAAVLLLLVQMMAVLLLPVQMRASR
jgi:hypothetical protein